MDNYMQMPQQIIPFIDTNAAAQNQTDMLKWQQQQQLAQAMMGTQIAPHSGRNGAIAGMLSGVLGMLANNRNNDKLSDILKTQFDIQNQAAQGKRKQDLDDEYRKMQEDIYKSQMGEKAKRDYAPLQFQASGSFDPASGTYTPSDAAAQQQIAIKGGEAEAAARANAKYREAPGAAGSAKLQQIQQIMAMPESPTKTAMLSSVLGEGGMQAMMFSGMGGGGAGAGGAAMGGPTGEEFLKSLNPQIAGQVKAISEGRQAPPTSMAMRSPMGQALMSAVSQYDPTFDATNYQSRSKARNAFTSGKEGQSLNAMNTAIGHAGELLDAGNALNNFGGAATLLNGPVNAAQSALGDPRLKNFNQTRDALAGELTKAFRGASGSEKDIAEVQANINAAGSPEQLRGAVGQAMKLLGSKAQSLNDQYKQAFGNSAAPNFNDPHAIAALQKLANAGVDLGPLGENYGITPGGQSPAGGGQMSLDDAALLKKYGGL